MTNDLELISRVREYIRSVDRYITFDELSTHFKMSRIQFTYRGVNLTSLNAELGFSRRPPKVWVAPANLDRSEVVLRIRETIRSHGKYLSISDITRKLHLFHEGIIRGFQIDVHAMNSEEGFVRKSPQEVVNKSQLSSKFEDYIFKSDHYVTQYELCTVFDVRPSLVTKSGIDTVALNLENGHGPFYSWFEDLLYSAMIDLGLSGITRQKMFDDCRSSRGRMLRFDFFIQDLSLAIEADGSQHWDERHPFHTPLVVEHDGKKESYCKDNDIRLIRVKHQPRKLTPQDLRSILLENLTKVLTKAELEKAGVTVDNEYFETISSQDSKET